MSMCNSCHRPVFWGKTEASGKRMPVDTHPVDDGNVLIVAYDDKSPVLRVLKKGEDPPDEVSRYVSHFVTCPHRDEHRKPR